MPRGQTSQADLLLIAELAASGIDVSPYKLERWRQAGQLPKPVRHGAGRGKGSTSRYPPEAVEIAAALAQVGAQGRSRHLGTLTLFRVGLGVSEQSVRDALAWAMADSYRRVRQGEQQNEFHVADMAHRASVAIKSDFPPLLAVAPAVGATRRQLKDRDRLRKQWQRLVGAKVLMKYGDVTGHELEEELQALGPEMAAMIADFVRQDEKQTSPALGAAGERDVGRMIDSIPFERLEAAREVLLRCATTNASLHALARYYAEVHEFLANLGPNPMFAELLILPGALADGVSAPAAFADLVVGFAMVEPQLVQAALYAWIVNSFVGAPARGFELVDQYAHEHQVQLPELPTFKQIGMIGLLDFRQEGIEERDLDLLEVLEEVGVPATAWVRELQTEWSRMMQDDEMEEEPDPM
jgi:hypothetical protein